MRQTPTDPHVYSPTRMTPRSVAAALTSRLESIRDVAQDLEREISRAHSDSGSGISAMVAYIRRETNAALKLLGTATDLNE
jgi:hypothetical protein